MYYPLEALNNHLFVQLPSGRWLVDTGSPQSFGEAPVQIDNINISVVPNFGPITLNQIRDFVGLDFVGLLGTDVLNRYICHFDVPNRRLGLLDELPSDLSQRRVQLELILGSAPVVTVEVEDLGAQRLILDTGAQYSYLNTPPPEGTQRIGRGTDFHPFLGSYDVEFFLRAIRLGSLHDDLQFACQPAVTEICKQAKTDGVLGLEVLLTRAVFYNPRAKELWV